ncbi:hypothetical protein [Aeromicrobium sp. HA]|uniref:hypothetical protein n=1 Tax=Aeromicrobium sp. HA TaxID=3009077 RepID=UPI0022B005C8|nr:hypothetical protein [Aeromicrobium sp. HA]
MTTGDERGDSRHAEPDDLLKHIIDLEGDFVEGDPREYDPVELIRYALAWPMDYWPAHAMKWLEQGVPSEALSVELGNIASDARRPQALRHRAKRLRRSPHTG